MSGVLIFKRFIFCIACCCVCGFCAADTVSDPYNFDAALANARNKCNGLSAELQEIKKMAAINTFVTGAGTVAGGGALYTGIKKSNIDKKLSELERKLAQLKTMSDHEFVGFLKEMSQYEDAMEEYNLACAQKKDLEKKSKNLGNWRTGLMVANTATAVAGTVIADQNEEDGRSIAERITECKSATNALKVHMGQSRLSGDEVTYHRLEKIITKCDDMYPRDLEKIYTHSQISKTSSAVNIGTGVAGTVASVVANTSSIRNDNTTRGQTREQNWNTAANVLAGTSTVASGVSTVFNAKTIKAINDNILYTTQCEEALKWE